MNETIRGIVSTLQAIISCMSRVYNKQYAKISSFCVNLCDDKP